VREEKKGPFKTGTEFLRKSDLEAIQKTIEKLSVATIENIPRLTTLLPMQ
jgi:hypothetical protein